jgi:hypothetical protein
MARSPGDLDPRGGEAVRRVTPADFRRHLRYISQVVMIGSMLVLAFVAITVGFDVHAMRRARSDELSELIEIRKGLFTRFDSFLWKVDTQSEITGITNKILADALVKMRAQVKESSDSSVKTATATTTIAREAVKQSAATTQLVEAVAETPKPVVNVEVPKQQPAPVVVQSPPVAVVHTPAPPAAKPPPPRRHRHPLRRLLPWEWFRHAGSE